MGWRVVVLVSCSFLLALPPAGAAAASEHCAFRLVPESSEGTITGASLELLGCYPTYAGSIEAGTGVAVEDDVTPGTLVEVELGVALSSDVLIGTEYDDTGFFGGSSSYFAPSTCSASNSWEVDWVGAAWNDRFESGRGFGGCDTNKKFQHVDFGGNVRTCTPNCTNYQGLANEVSSLRWRP